MHVKSPAAVAAAAAFFLRRAAAILPPAYDGLSVVWQDAFDGAAGAAPDTSRWRIVTGNLGVNGELETYTSAPQNVQLSGGGSVQLVPWKGGADGSGNTSAVALGGNATATTASGGWTSGRIETLEAFTPAAGRTTRVEGSLRMGDHAAANKQGVWPAFWMLGEALRYGTPWPLCGELDILEQRNGEATGFGTAHCGDTGSGGLCNEPTGRGSTVGVGVGGGAGNDNANATAAVLGSSNATATAAASATPFTAFQTWSVTWDLTSSDWASQQIVWAVGGQPYFALTGQALGDAATWSTLAHSPFYVVLNVAIGGGFPGSPNDETLDGYGSMMEVQYVAVYSG